MRKEIGTCPICGAQGVCQPSFISHVAPEGKLLFPLHMKTKRGKDHCKGSFQIREEDQDVEENPDFFPDDFFDEEE